MTNPDYRHYVLIVDRSGSMFGTEHDATGGIRQFLSDQAALPGKATLTLYQFDTVHETVHDFSDLSAAQNYELKPRGGTALLDAVGYAVTQVGYRLERMPEDNRPGKVVVLIVTDGQENSSHEFDLDQVKAMLSEQQDKYGWAVSYIGPSVDAFETGASMGVAMASSLGYTAGDSNSTRAMYRAASAATTRMVKSDLSVISYTGKERDDALGEEDEL